MEETNKFDQLKGAIIDIVTRSCDDADDFDTMMWIGELIEQIKEDYDYHKSSALRYKQLWYGHIEKEKELNEKLKKLQETVDELKEP